MKHIPLLHDATGRHRIGLLSLVLLFSASEHASAQQDPNQLDWLKTRSAGLRDAQLKKRPMLIRISAEWCPSCRRLDEELEKPSVQTALMNWTLVELDFDRQSDEARALGVESIPALRVIAPTGRLLESHDGFLPEAKLIDWLAKSFDRATEAPEESLFSSGPPTPIELRKIIRQFADRDAAIREAAIRRLVPFPFESAEAVVGSLKQERLSVRLASLELLREWRAPLEEIDPWQPETVTNERIGRLEEWVATLTSAEAAPRELSPEELAQARTDLDRLLTADAPTALAIRERLARHKEALLPEIVQRLTATTIDEDRSRLLAMRYRLVMQDQLALNSPGLVDRLASIDLRTRHQAVRELSNQATPDCQPLFLELFADPDPLVRELSLFGLRAVGGDDGQNSLVKLLDDPDPNVRAAVLKLFAESPWPELQPRLAEYVKTEQDTGLLVHAARCFRKLKSRSPGNLIPLLKHRDWQVRAEVLDTLTGAWQRHADSETEKMMQNDEVRDAVAECMNDDDPFVVSRAIKGISHHLSKQIVKNLIQIPKRHPSLMNDVVTVLGTAAQFKQTVLPALKELFQSEDSTIRAAAIRGLCQLDAENAQAELISALRDPQIEVRLAAANTLRSVLDAMQRFNHTSDLTDFTSAVEPESTTEVEDNELMQNTVPRPEDDAETPADKSNPEKDTSDRNDDENVPEPATIEMEKQAIENEDAPSNEDEEKPQNELPRHDPSTEPQSDGGLFGLIRNLFGGSEPQGDDPVIQAPKRNQNQLKSSVEKGLERDRWLKDFHAGKQREKWLLAMIPPLEAMFASDVASEQIASAVPLVALGRFDLVEPQIINLARQGGKNADDLVAIFEWLPFTDRVQLADKFMNLPTSEHFVVSILRVFSQFGDVRDADFVWNLSETEHANPLHLSETFHCLKRIYFGEQSYNPSQLTVSQKKRIYKIAEQQLSMPRSWRHIVALAVMNDVRPDNQDDATEPIQEAAQALAEDEHLAPNLRADARQLSVAVVGIKARRELLIDWVKSGNVQLRLIAFHTLLKLDGSLSELKKSGISLSIESDNENEAVDLAQHEPIALEPPRGLTVEIVRPLMADGDEETRALVGYVLAISGDSTGLRPLLAYWQSKTHNDDGWTRLVYRAIAATDDSSQLPILMRIYKELDIWEFNEFYWTIRNMTGPKILEFRKRIRKEKSDWFH